MPARNYMVVDPRHDHSMRIPRPDLSVTLGTPNACNNCHRAQSAQWAADRVGKWYGDAEPGYQQYAVTLADARSGAGSGDALAALARNPATPAIARATALAAIGPYLSNETVDVIGLGLADSDAAVRVATLATLESVPPELRVQFAFPMLADPVRAVRFEAARVLRKPISATFMRQRAIGERRSNPIPRRSNWRPITCRPMSTWPIFIAGWGRRKMRSNCCNAR
jgi:hypothetical protein